MSTRTALSGKSGSMEFRPLDETRRTGIEIVVGADIEGFVYVLNAVEIKVEDGTVQHAAVVFVDNGERWANLPHHQRRARRRAP